MTISKRLSTTSWRALACAVVMALPLSFVVPAAIAANEAAVDEMMGYLDFSEYGGGVIFAEQIPAAEYENIMVIDARDAEQFDKAHIPGAVNIEWRQVLNERDSLPTDQMVLIYCNTGSLSAQAGFALRVAGHDNVRILQGGFEEWKAKGGFEANARALEQASRD